VPSAVKLPGADATEMNISCRPARDDRIQKMKKASRRREAFHVLIPQFKRA
jgi:hypothetical protein